MTIRLRPVVLEDEPALVDFLTSNSFPFHVTAQHTRESAEAFVTGGHFRSDGSQGYWIEDASEDDRVGHGIAVLKDLQDDTVMIDLRLAAASRGRGLGTSALVALADLVFATLPDARRLEGQTREDNTAMRRAFRSAGFVQEAFFRQGWPVTNGSFTGSVSYALLRDDWHAGTTTPLPPGEPRRDATDHQ